MFTPVATTFLEDSGIQISIVLAIVGLAFAGYLIKGIFAASPGNERMRQIAGAIEEGAKAYMSRQIAAISVIAVILFAIIWAAKDGKTAAGFLIGAVCSLVAGF